MIGSFARLLAALLVLLAFAGCRQSAQPDAAPDVELTIDFARTPPLMGNDQITVTLRAADGAALADVPLEIRGDMNHAGMQPVLRSGRTGEDGRFSTPFEWTMAGDWFVTVRATLPDGRIKTERVDLRVAVP